MNVMFIRRNAHHVPVVSTGQRIKHGLCLRRDGCLPLHLGRKKIVPVVFTSTILMLPVSLARCIAGPTFGHFIDGCFGPASLLCITICLLLVLFFDCFCSSLIVGPRSLSHGLGGVKTDVPNVHPNGTAASCVNHVLGQLAFLNTVFLNLITIIPDTMRDLAQMRAFHKFKTASLLVLMKITVSATGRVRACMVSRHCRKVIGR